MPANAAEEAVLEKSQNKTQQKTAHRKAPSSRKRPAIASPATSSPAQQREAVKLLEADLFKDLTATAPTRTHIRFEENNGDTVVETSTVVIPESSSGAPRDAPAECQPEVQPEVQPTEQDHLPTQLIEALCLMEERPEETLEEPAASTKTKKACPVRVNKKGVSSEFHGKKITFGEEKPKRAKSAKASDKPKAAEPRRRATKKGKPEPTPEEHAAAEEQKKEEEKTLKMTAAALRMCGPAALARFDARCKERKAAKEQPDGHEDDIFAEKPFRMEKQFAQLQASPVEQCEEKLRDRLQKRSIYKSVAKSNIQLA